MIWNSNNWQQQFNKISAIKNPDEKQEGAFWLHVMRKEVFQHTIFLVRQQFYFNDEGKKIELLFPNEIIYKTRFYRNVFMVDSLPQSTEKTEVRVKNMDCLVAARELLDEGFNPAVLNMANRQNPGGGVINGAGAQEENLFRRSNLYCSLYQFAPYAGDYGLPRAIEHYPMDRNFGGIYTPNATIFRGTEQDGYPLLDNPYQVSVISVAGLNRPELDGEGRIVPELIEPAKNKIRTIFRIGLANGHDSLVLGALGCGAFRNPPTQMAELFRQVMHEAEFENKFKLLLFAIYEDHNSHHAHNPEGNYLPFAREFGCE